MSENWDKRFWKHKSTSLRKSTYEDKPIGTFLLYGDLYGRCRCKHSSNASTNNPTIVTCQRNTQAPCSLSSTTSNICRKVWTRQGKYLKPTLKEKGSAILKTRPKARIAQVFSNFKQKSPSTRACRCQIIGVHVPNLVILNCLSISNMHLTIKTYRILQGNELQWTISCTCQWVYYNFYCFHL